MPRYTHAQIYDMAIERVSRAEDNSYREEDLVQEMAKLINFDEARERINKAKKIIDNRAKPGSTEPVGQLCLPGFDPYDYEPQRLVRDDDGNVVENSKASPVFKTAEARRARKHMREAMEWSNRKSEEQEIFSLWATKEARRGRPVAELTWENCVKESGFWMQTAPSETPSIAPAE